VVRLAHDLWNLRFLIGVVNGAFAFDDANRDHFESKWNDWCAERARRVSKLMTDHPHDREPLLSPTNACWLAAIKGAHKPTSHKPGAKKAAAKRAAKDTKASKDSSKHAKDSKGKNESSVASRVLFSPTAFYPPGNIRRSPRWCASLSAARRGSLVYGHSNLAPGPRGARSSFSTTWNGAAKCVSVPSPFPRK
jgi:hypothetical protein